MGRIGCSVVILVLSACAGSTSTTTPSIQASATLSTSAVGSPPAAVTSPPASLVGDEGVAVVDVGVARYEFRLSRCIVGGEVFVVEGDDGRGSVLRLRHASPPPRQPPQPSMSSLVITGAVELESAPASVTFESYDTARGIATGSAWLTTDVDRPTAFFDIECG